MIKDSRILLIGGTGSLGKELIKRYQEDNKIIVVSRNEQNQVLLSKEKWVNSTVSFALGDIRDYRAMVDIILKYKPNVVINAAALKHVDVCEKNPTESIGVNIQGNINLISAVRSSSGIVKNLIFISTDKACKPINTYGMCKAISERLYLEYALEEDAPKVSVLRYGNVLNSSGSVIPLFTKMLKNGATELPITDGRMTRFIFTLTEAVELIDKAYSSENSHGKILIPTLKSFRLEHLAQILIYHFALGRATLKTIGVRAGEKLHEELLSPEEWLYSDITQKYLLDFEPTSSDSYELFNSEFNVVDKDTLEAILKKEGLLEH